MMTERMVFGPFAGTSAGWSAARSSSRMTEHGRAPAGGAAPESEGGEARRLCCVHCCSVSDLQLSVLAATPERMLAEVSSSVLYKRSPTRPPTPLAACWPPMPRPHAWPPLRPPRSRAF